MRDFMVSQCKKLEVVVLSLAVLKVDVGVAVLKVAFFKKSLFKAETRNRPRNHELFCCLLQIGWI